MKIKYEELHDILAKQFGWIEIKVPILRWHYGKQITIDEIVLKHPLKKLYYYSSTFGEQYRVYKGRQVDITHQYYTLVGAEYDFNAVIGTLTLDDFICINLR